MQHHFMRDTAGIKKLFLKLWSGAHYCRVAQIYWVARHKQTKKQIHGLSKKHTYEGEAYLDICDIWLGKNERIRFLMFNVLSSERITELYHDDAGIVNAFGTSHKIKL